MQRRRFLTALLGTLGGSAATLSAAIHQPRPGPTPALLLQESELAGFDHYHGKSRWAELQIGDRLQLRREPDNRHDPHAVAIYYRGSQLGYVPRRENRTLAQLLDRGQPLHAQICQLQQHANPWRRIRLQILLEPSRQG